MLFIALLLALIAPSTAVIWAVLAAPAAAAEVHVVSECHKSDCDVRAVFTAAPGERNALTVEHETTQVVILRDTGAALTAAAGCTALDANAARCVATYSDRIGSDAALGDGDDRASSDGGSVDGGAGNDDLTTSGGALTGGPGEDVLRSDQRGAYFYDGDARTPARDRYLGGQGRNTLSYGGRTDDVRVDLRRAGPGGTAGERDHVEGIEDAIGGSGDDVLIGDGRANELVSHERFRTELVQPM